MAQPFTRRLSGVGEGCPYSPFLTILGASVCSLGPMCFWGYTACLAIGHEGPAFLNGAVLLLTAKRAGADSASYYGAGRLAVDDHLPPRRDGRARAGMPILGLRGRDDGRGAVAAGRRERLLHHRLRSGRGWSTADDAVTGAQSDPADRRGDAKHERAALHSRSERLSSSYSQSPLWHRVSLTTQTGFPATTA